MSEKETAQRRPSVADWRNLVNTIWARTAAASAVTGTDRIALQAISKDIRQFEEIHGPITK